MYYCKREDAEGHYLNEAGQRIALFESEQVICPPGQTPEENGWYVFHSLEECLAAWHLTYDPIPIPEPEPPYPQEQE